MSEKKKTDAEVATQLLQGINKDLDGLFKFSEKRLRDSLVICSKSIANTFLLKADPTTINYALLLQARISGMLIVFIHARELMEPLMTVEEAREVAKSARKKPPESGNNVKT